ncbi:MAG: alkene reductase, partial [Verrucomicrobiota bacterium]
MAPLTRMRATMPGNVPNDLNVEYYRQRAGAGLIIAEATAVSPLSYAYYAAPGIYTQAQIEGWRKITNTVHAEGGNIFLQLWHAGRQAHSELLPPGERPIAPSSIKAENTQCFLQGRAVDAERPREMTHADITRVIDEFRVATLNARAAGFDGVELHAANGYLPDSFLQNGSNHRRDEYGGSIRNRTRFVIQLIEAITKAWSEDRVGIRLSPASSFGDMGDSDTDALFTELVSQLNEFKLAYLHLVEPRVRGNDDVELSLDLGSSRFRKVLRSDVKLIAAGGYSPEEASQKIDSGDAQLIGLSQFKCDIHGNGIANFPRCDRCRT